MIDPEIVRYGLMPKKRGIKLMYLNWFSAEPGALLLWDNTLKNSTARLHTKVLMEIYLQTPVAESSYECSL